MFIEDYSLFSKLLTFLSDQEGLGAFVNNSEATLKDYDAYLKSLEEKGTDLTTAQYEEIATKINNAIADMKKATTLEDAQEIYDEILADVYSAAKVNSSLASIVDTFEDAVAAVVESREDAKKLATEHLNKCLEVSKTMEDLTAHDKGVISDLVSGALEEVNNAKTAKEVTDAESKLGKLLVDGGYTKLQAEVARQNAILEAQKEAYKVLDAYESALNNMTDFADKAKVQNAIAAARRNILDAENSDEVVKVKNAFVEFINNNYDAMTKPAAQTLLDNELEEAIETLNAYKTGAYADEKDPDDREKTIENVVNGYIETLKTTANVSTNSLTLESYKTVDTKLANYVKILNEKIAKIKKEAEENQEAYMESYRAAVEELKVYEDNAKEFNLTSEQLEYINSLISNTKGKIAEVTTAQEVVTAMTVFRNAVAEYYSDFDQYQIEEIRKIAISKLEEYNDLSTDIDTLVTEGVEAVKSQTTVSGIQTELQKALDEINVKIKSSAIAKAKVEARAKFYVFLRDNDEELEYSDKIYEIASKAIDAINNATNERDVEHAVENYMAQIDEELEKLGTSLANEVKVAQEKAKEQTALYRELANTITDVNKRQELLNTIKLYEDSILSKDATKSSIARDEKALREFIETFEVELVSAKVNAIEYIKAIGEKYFLKVNNAAIVNTLSDYTTNNELDYEKLIKDPYVKAAFDDAIEIIKNATKSEELEVDTKNSPKGDKITTAKNTVDSAVIKLSNMVKVKNTVKEKLTGTGLDNYLTELNISEGAKNKAKDFLKNYYEENIATITLDDYVDNSNIFTEKKNNVEAALKNYLNGEIKKEALANLNVTNVAEAVKKANSDSETILETTLSNLQRNVSITTNEKGEGVVTGQLHNVKLVKFSKTEELQTGYFLTLSLGSTTAKKVKIASSSGEEKELESDGIVTIRFADKKDLSTKKITVKYYNDDGTTLIQSITISDFSKLELVGFNDWTK